jgi:uncharacterized RmlC-like cupin family protein
MIQVLQRPDWYGLKGDIVITPGGVPHSWRSLEGDITYLIIRADPNNQITLK